MDEVLSRVYIDGKTRPILSRTPVGDIRAEMESEGNTVQFLNEYGAGVVLDAGRIVDVVEQLPTEAPVDITGAMFGKGVKVRAINMDDIESLNLAHLLSDGETVADRLPDLIVVEGEDLAREVVLILDPADKGRVYVNQAEPMASVERFTKVAILAAEATQISTDFYVQSQEPQATTG